MDDDAAPLDVLVVTGGHPFDAPAFEAVFAALAEDGSMDCRHATAPVTGHDVVVFYDMPGLRVTGQDPPVDLIEPTAEQRAVIEQLTADGTGLVFLHHAIAGWPVWDAYAHLVGGRFHYAPGELDGVAYPDSGYRFDVEHLVEVIEPEHPVCAGLGAAFTIVDELYCFPVLEGDVVPLMRTTFDTADDRNFFSADLAIRGRRNRNDGWHHPPGSNLVAWARRHERSRVVYLQFGDGPTTYADAHYRRALDNAIRWVAHRPVRSDP